MSTDLTTSEIVRFALKEDLPEEDLTCLGCGVKDQFVRAQIIAKEDLILSGQEVAKEVFQQVDSELVQKWKFVDSNLILKGQVVAFLEGSALSVLTAERTALNFLGQLSGIASLTHSFANETKGTNCKILDTRKTTPLLRDLEKQAVVHGGGVNHRRNLSDKILVKENHIQISGGLDKVLDSLNEFKDEFIEIEVQSLDEVKQLSNSQIVDRVLLDNMTNEQMQEAVSLLKHSNIQTEASGNMTLERIRPVALTGVDFISVGALTHSAPCADFSLLIDEVRL